MNIKQSLVCTTALVLTFLLAIPKMMAADKTDTPEDVMTAGKKATAEITRLINELRGRAGNADAATRSEIDARIKALTKLQPLASKLAQNRTFAAQVLDKAFANDKSGMAALMERDTAGARLQIREIRDFWFMGFIEFDGGCYSVEIGAKEGFKFDQYSCKSKR